MEAQTDGLVALVSKTKDEGNVCFQKHRAIGIWLPKTRVAGIFAKGNVTYYIIFACPA